MGTSGLMAFEVDGMRKISYRHYDAYPATGGVEVLRFCQDVTDWEAVRQGVRDLVEVDPEDSPSPEQVKMLAGHWHKNWGGHDTWHAHLAETQGDPGLILAAGFISTSSKPNPYNEYSYVIDLDKKELRAYVGNFRALLGAWPLDALPTDDEMAELDS